MKQIRVTMDDMNHEKCLWCGRFLNGLEDYHPDCLKRKVETELGCKHKWSAPLVADGGFVKDERIVLMSCEHCGTIKKEVL